MSQYIQVVTTVAAADDARRIARVLVERRLAGCVQITGPIESVYRWQGRVETAQEWLCTAKTRLELWPKIEAAIREMHTYQTPEILAVPATAGSAAYLAWLDQEVDETMKEEG